MSKLTNWQVLPPGTEVFFMRDNRVRSGEITHGKIELDPDFGSWGNKSIAEIVYTIQEPKAVGVMAVKSDLVAESKAELLSRL